MKGKVERPRLVPPPARAQSQAAPEPPLARAAATAVVAAASPEPALSPARAPLQQARARRLAPGYRATPTIAGAHAGQRARDDAQRSPSPASAREQTPPAAREPATAPAVQRRAAGAVVQAMRGPPLAAAPRAQRKARATGAYAVLRGPAPSPALAAPPVRGGRGVQRKACPSCGAPGASPGAPCTACAAALAPPAATPSPIQMQAASAAPSGASPDPAERQADEIGARIGRDLGGVSAASPGPISRGVRGVAERHLGVDLGGTHLRADSGAHDRAAGMDAVAVTEGSRVSFARGELSSGSTRGRALLGHELTHVAQQRAHGAPTAAPQRKPAPGPAAPGSTGGGGGGSAAAPASAPSPAPSPSGGGAAGPAAAASGGGEVHMPPVPMDLSPAEDARLAAAGGRAHAAADAKTDLPPSAEETSAARGAVEEPASEVAARAQADFIAALGEEPQPDPGLTAMCTQLQQDIANRRPSSEQEIAKQNPQQEAEKVGESVNGQVQAGAEKAGAPVAKIDAPPAGQAAQQPTPIENPPADVPAPNVQAGQATPDPVPAKNVSIDADVKAQDEKLKGAGMETDAAKEAAKSGDGPLADAQKAQGDLGALAKTAPEKVLADQAAALAKANAGMTALQGQTVAALGHWRTTGIAGDRGKQDRMVLTEHQKRDKASSDAKAIYSRASADVTALVKAMPDAIRGKWDAGIKTISTEFESSLNRVKGWLAERYADVGGFFNKLGDSLFGLPDWIVDDYTRAEAKFGKDACDLALDLSKTVNGTLLAVDKIIQIAKQQIDDIFDALAKELPDWAAQQKASFDKDFASLRDNAHKQAADLQADLRKNAFQSIQDARQKIQELRDATKSLIDQIEEAAEEFAKDPAKFIINGLLKLVNIPPDAFWAVVAKVQRVVDDIAKDPLTFANNLAAAIGQGFRLFFDNIGTHLLQGLIDWLFSALGDVGVQAPADTSLKSMVTLFLQVMGITWPRIRKIIAKHIGEQNVALIEKAWALISPLIAMGPAGVFEWIKGKLNPQMIVDAVINGAKDFIIRTLIEKVGPKIIAMFNPAGAIAEAVVVIYDVLKWVFQNAARIFRLVETVVNAMADIMSGNTGGVAKAIESALTGLLGPVIGFLADLIGLGDLPQSIAGVIKGLQDEVAVILDQVVGFLVEQAKALLKAIGLGGKDDKDKPEPKGHAGIVAAIVEDLETVQTPEDYDALRPDKESQASALEAKYAASLEQGVALKVVFAEPNEGSDAEEVDFEVIIAPNDERKKGKAIATPEIPEQRELPSSWSGDTVRRKYYINGSGFEGKKSRILTDGMVQVQKAIELLQSKDTEENAGGKAIWADLYGDQVVPDPSFSKSKKSSYLDPGNYDVDHAVPLAWDWEFQSGNDSEYGARQAIAGGESNLKLMWGSLNRAKGSKGPDGNAGRYTNKFWVGKNFTHQYSDDKRLADDSTPFANMKKKR